MIIIMNDTVLESGHALHHAPAKQNHGKFKSTCVYDNFGRRGSLFFGIIVTRWNASRFLICLVFLNKIFAIESIYCISIALYTHTKDCFDEITLKKKPHFMKESLHILSHSPLTGKITKKQQLKSRDLDGPS